jgi:hypothetical protein
MSQIHFTDESIIESFVSTLQSVQTTKEFVHILPSGWRLHNPKMQILEK